MIMALAALLLLSGCALPKRPTLQDADPMEYYARFLAFAECWVVEIANSQACDLETAQELVNYISARRRLFVSESDGADWYVRYETLRDVLWAWLDYQRKTEKMTTRQFKYFAELLMGWG